MNEKNNSYSAKHLMFQADERIYEFGAVSVNEITQELFYIFKHKSKDTNTVTVQPVQKGMIKEGKTVETGQPEHISFHREELIHLKCRKYGGNPKAYPLKVPVNIYDKIDKERISVVLIHSIMLVEGDYALKEKKKQLHIKNGYIFNKRGKIDGYMFALPRKLPFSALIILLDKSVIPSSRLQLRRLTEASYPGLIKSDFFIFNLFGNLVCAVALTDKLIQDPFRKQQKTGGSTPTDKYQFYLCPDKKDLTRMMLSEPPKLASQKK